MAPGPSSKFGGPMFEPEVFQKQMYRIERSTCDIVRTFWLPPQSFGAPVMIRHPGNCAPLSPLVTPLAVIANICEALFVTMHSVMAFNHFHICAQAVPEDSAGLCSSFCNSELLNVHSWDRTEKYMFLSSGIFSYKCEVTRARWVRCVLVCYVTSPSSTCGRAEGLRCWS